MAEGGPPGRAGRLWLTDRLGHARRALDLLDRKRRILRLRVTEAAAARDRAAEAWGRACSDAGRAALVAHALAGAWTVDLAAGAVRDGATVSIEGADTVGVRHPGRPRVDLPPLPVAYVAAGGPAVAGAADAHRAALRCAVDLAVAARTYELLDAELGVTERRYRAIERIRLPQLESRLRQLNLRLDELERQERMTTRWVSERPRGGARGGVGRGGGGA